MCEPTFQVPAREHDAQEGRQFSEVHADELAADDLDYMDPNERIYASEWLMAIDRAERCTDVATLHNAEPLPETLAECGALAAE